MQHTITINDTLSERFKTLREEIKDKYFDYLNEGKERLKGSNVEARRNTRLLKSRTQEVNAVDAISTIGTILCLTFYFCSIN